MDSRAFDTVARSAAELAPRRSLLLLGGASLAAALAGSRVANAARSKAKKKCGKQKKQCRQFVQNFCAGGTDEQGCLDLVLPCCQSCKVKAGVLCVLNIEV